jgi:VanZ family protein
MAGTHYGPIAPALRIGNSLNRAKCGAAARIFPVAEVGISGADGVVQASAKSPVNSVSRMAWIWPVALAGVIFAASSRPQVVNVGAWPGADKAVHFVVYGLLGVLCRRLGRGRRAAMLAVLAASAYGATDEWHQSFVPSRAAELADWVADTLGAAVAVSIYARSPRMRHLLETPARLLGQVGNRAQPEPLP